MSPAFEFWPFMVPVALLVVALGAMIWMEIRLYKRGG